MKNLRLASLTNRALLAALALALVPTSTACKPKEKKVEPAAVEPAAVEAAPAPTPSEVPPPTKSAREPATEAEIALAKEFLPRFAATIEASKSDGWLELQSKAQREKLVAKDAVEQSYAAWVVGTKPVVEALKTSEFRMEKLPDQRFVLTFDSIPVPNDPTNAYLMHFVVEEGKLLLDEN